MHINEHIIQTPLGLMRLWASEAGVLRADFADSDYSKIEVWARRMLGDYQIHKAGDHPILQEAGRQLGDYFAGERRAFDIPIDLRGTSFQYLVWHRLCSIPIGSTWTYKELALQIGHPAAIRAVGAANALNPISVIVPCHRLIGSDGTLHGYGGGLGRKRALLEHERVKEF